MAYYRIRLERDLKRWLEAGFVSEAGAAAIRADVAAHRSKIGAAQVFALLGAVLFGFAIMSFVAANWDGMSKLARMLLLLVSMWGCYAGAAWLFSRQLVGFGHAAVVGGIAVYGASIMLIAQMYHMEGNPPDAVLMWALGALVTALLARSPAALGSAFVLGVVWSVYERNLSDGPHWAFLAFWIAACATARWLRWRPALHLAAVSLLVWLVPLGAFVGDRHAHWIVVAIGLAAALAAAFGASHLDRFGPISAPALVYAVATAYAGLFILQFIDDRAIPGVREPDGLMVLVALSVVSLALLLAAMAWGIQHDNAGALWLAYSGFAVEIFALYGKTLGSLLNTSLFFLVAALIVTGLAWFAWRLHNRQQPVTVPSA